MKKLTQKKVLAMNIKRLLLLALLAASLTSCNKEEQTKCGKVMAKYSTSGGRDSYSITIDGESFQVSESTYNAAKWGSYFCVNY